MPDWDRIFPDSAHRWIMGLRRSNRLGDYFADSDPSGQIRRERSQWLELEPEKYAILCPAAEVALDDTVEFARSLGGKIPSGVSRYSQLLELGRWWELDFVLMVPGEDGIFRPQGGVVCFPSSWALAEKIGQPMQFVHEPVPDLNQALGRQIDTFLTKLNPGEGWQRENWSLARDGRWNHHPSRPRQRLDETVRSDEVWLRLEHQLLLKFPSSGAVFFGIRMEVVPLQEVIKVPDAARRFARLLSTIHESAAAYKGFASARNKLVQILQGDAKAAPEVTI